MVFHNIGVQQQRNMRDTLVTDRKSCRFVFSFSESEKQRYVFKVIYSLYFMENFCGRKSLWIIWTHCVIAYHGKL